MVRLENVSVARAGKPVLTDIRFAVNAGDRIYISGENGAGKSSLLMLLAGKLHPYNNAGSRSYAWDGLSGEDFRSARKHLTLVSRDEQQRLQGIHSTSTVREFLHGHLEGEDFLYRKSLPGDAERIEAQLGKFVLAELAARKLKTLSLGEMRLTLIARADLHTRQLYLLDEVFSSLSPAVAERVAGWIRSLSPECAVVMTGHDGDRMAEFSYTDRYRVSGGKVLREDDTKPVHGSPARKDRESRPVNSTQKLLIESVAADFYHDFTQIFKKMTFQLHSGDRILLTGANGSGKTTLLRILHGDFYPAWDSGTLSFLGELAHERKSELWARVQFIAAAHFNYYPQRMVVREILASRYSGSIYSYPDVLPDTSAPVIAEFALKEYLERPFSRLSEGEKTRVLLARAFFLPAPVYLIDEGFIALSERYFSSAVRYLNGLPAESAVVIAANERIGELKRHLDFTLTEWQLASGRLAGPTATPL